MNVDTGEVKRLQDLTEEERKSGKWIELPKQFGNLRFPKSKSDLKREAYMQRVLEKKKVGENV